MNEDLEEGEILERNFEFTWTQEALDKGSAHMVYNTYQAPTFHRPSETQNNTYQSSTGVYNTYHRPSDTASDIASESGCNPMLLQMMEVVHLYKALVEKCSDAEVLCTQLDAGLELINSIS